MRINVGIVGYGNLGKSVERIVLSRNDLNLVAIFSRRVIKSNFNTKIESYENISLYRNKIDVMMLCGGSFSDLPKQTSDALMYFDCINSFDNHKKLYSEYQRLGNLAKTTNHRLIMSCGWDPGIFSILRTFFREISDTKPITFWGKGISMGHSDAIRRVKNVIDGVEFTVPNKEAVKLARTSSLSGDEAMHSRECFVVAEKKHHKAVERQIKNIPDYFKGQETSVNFVSSEELLKLKSNASHKGEIISNFSGVDGSKSSFSFKLKTSSNSSLTATIMVKYVNAILNLKRNKMKGAFLPIDIPVSFLFNPNRKKKMIEKYC